MKNRTGQDHKYRGGIIILNRTVRVNLIDEVSFEQRLEEGEG